MHEQNWGGGCSSVIGKNTEHNKGTLTELGGSTVVAGVECQYRVHWLNWGSQCYNTGHKSQDRSASAKLCWGGEGKGGHCCYSRR